MSSEIAFTSEFERMVQRSGQQVEQLWRETLRYRKNTAIILEAYRLVEGAEYRNRIALASGLTIPEAHAAEILPFQMIPGLRKGDSVTSEQCTQAMIQERASTL